MVAGLGKQPPPLAASSVADDLNADCDDDDDTGCPSLDLVVSENGNRSSNSSNKSVPNEKTSASFVSKLVSICTPLPELAPVSRIVLINSGLKYVSVDKLKLAAAEQVCLPVEKFSKELVLVAAASEFDKLPASDG